jgi:hypothetical protein
MQQWGEKIFSNQELGMRVYIRIIMMVLVKFATSKNLVKNRMFPHQNTYKYTWTSAHRKTHNQIDHTLIDRRWHSGILDV